MSDYLILRGANYYYMRRIPAHLKRYDPRPFVRVSLKTSDKAQARSRAAVQNEVLEAYWRNLVAAKKVHGADESWKDAVAFTRAHGFSYKSIEELTDAPVTDLVNRLQVLEREGVQPETADALLGGAGMPVLPLSAALPAYFELTRDRVMGKSKDYIRKWENPRKRAVANFIDAIGDKPVARITRRDILDFKKWWLEKIQAEKKNAATANKDLVHLKDILRAVCQDQELDVDIGAMFSDTMLRQRGTSRAAFEAAFVQDHILKPGKLDGLNLEARCLVYMMADTGARVNEIIGLQPEDIVLDADIPHILIRPNKKRTLKTRQSERQIPLVGAALYAAKLVPEGFPRYNVADSASGLVNQYFDNNQLKPSPTHTLYSLRHTFKDRLRDIGAPEEVIDNLMGHASRGPKYGRGHLLKTKNDWMQKIAYKPPTANAKRKKSDL